MIDEPEGLADGEDDRAEASDAKTPDVLGADNGMDHDEQIVAFYEREELLPTPDILAEYYAISRDTGDRVVGLAEQALTHGRASKQEEFRLTRIAFISIPVTTIAFIAGGHLGRDIRRPRQRHRHWLRRPPRPVAVQLEPPQAR